MARKNRKEWRPGMTIEEKQELFEDVRGLVLYAAKKYISLDDYDDYCDLDDLAQEALLAVWTAIRDDKYDPERLSSFAHYCYVVAEWAMKSYKRDQEAKSSGFSAGRRALDEALKAKKNDSLNYKQRILLNRAKSLDYKPDDAPEDWVDVKVMRAASMTDRYEIYDQAMGDDLRAAVELLPDRERNVISWFYLDDEEHTLEEGAEVFGMSAQRVGQIRKRGLALLRHPRTSSKLIDYAR